MRSLAHLAPGTAALALLALLTGCAATPRPPGSGETTAPAAPETATVLLPVRLAVPPEPGSPAPLMELTLATAQGPQAAFTQVPAAPAASTAHAAESSAADTPADATGRDYLFRLPLPPGRYRVAALQLREGSRQRTLALDLPFDVDSPAPRYLGRLIVRPAADGQLALDTAWLPHEDIARYRSQPAAGLHAQGVQLQPVVARGPAAAALPTITAPPPRTDPMDTALANASAALRQAFQRYRTLKPPKAFAVSDDGRWSSAQGAGDAPVRSLMDCAHQGGRCRLLAIDDRLVVQGAR